MGVHGWWCNLLQCSIVFAAAAWRHVLHDIIGDVSTVNRAAQRDVGPPIRTLQSERMEGGVGVGGWVDVGRWKWVADGAGFDRRGFGIGGGRINFQGFSGPS